MATSVKTPRHQLSLLERLNSSRAISDCLFRVLREDAYYDRPIAERHRVIFYLGHLEAFDWNLFLGRTPRLRAFHPEFDHLFAFGIDPVDGGLPSDLPQDWPSIERVREYGHRVRAQLDDFLSAGPGDLAADLSTLLHTAIEHRLMHAETLTYMFHRLPFERKAPQSQPSFTSGDFSPAMVEIPAGNATLGLRRCDGQFGWDNEYEAHTLDVPAFKIDRFMVTNGEYRDFVHDSGYRERKWWSEADWNWVNQQGIGRPAFWIDDGTWLYHGMFDAVALPSDWPAYVSHAEAAAYARWAGKSLPSEAQWHRAAYGEHNGEREYPWGQHERVGKGNFDFARWDPSPVNSMLNNTSAFGAVGMLGNGWEWTSTEFAPFRGFQAFPFYPGYSANFFDGRHFVLKGGSARTASSLLRRSFRNWFQPHYQYVYAGFRCVTEN